MYNLHDAKLIQVGVNYSVVIIVEAMQAQKYLPSDSKHFQQVSMQFVI